MWIATNMSENQYLGLCIISGDYIADCSKSRNENSWWRVTEEKNSNKKTKSWHLS